MSGSTFNIVKANGSVIPGAGNVLYDEREKDDVRADDGAMHHTSAAVIRTAPIAQFSTVAVRSLFTALGTGDEVPFVLLDGTNGIELLGAQVAATPGLAGGSVHARRQFVNGILLLDKLSWRSSGLFEAQATAYARSTAGGTDPIVRTATTAPTIPLNTERLGLVSLAIGGSNVGKLLSIDLDVQHQVENNDEGQGCYDASLPHPVALKMPGAGGATMVKATIDTLDLTSSFANGNLVLNAGVLNHLGVGMGATGIIATINGGFVRSRSITGPGGAAARRLEVFGIYDGTNKPLTIATF